MNSVESKYISCVVPIYNVEPYLDECLESITEQSHKNISIILVNDGSTDNSTKIALKYLLTDKRVTLINKINGGQSNARNAGFSYIKNELNDFIITIDELRAATEQQSNRATEQQSNRATEQHDYNEERINKDLIEFLSKKIKDETEGAIDYKKRSLHDFVINFNDGNEAVNYFGITSIYSHHKSIKTDYVNFTDSDDFIDKTTFKTALEYLAEDDFKPELCWYDVNRFIDDERVDENHLGAHLTAPIEYFEDKECLTPLELFGRLGRSTGTTCNAIFSYKILKLISFIDAVVVEDFIWQSLIFTLANHIKLCKRQLYHYRLRAYSTSMYEGEYSPKSFPPFVGNLNPYFKTSRRAHGYFYCYSMLISMHYLDYYFKHVLRDKNLMPYLSGTIKSMGESAIYSLTYESDPLNAKLRLFSPFDGSEVIRNYWSFLSLKSRMAYRFPRAYYFLASIKRIVLIKLRCKEIIK